MDMSPYLFVFEDFPEDFPIHIFDRDQYREHGITILDDKNLIYSLASNPVTVKRYSFATKEAMEEWCVLVTNIKMIADSIPSLARHGEAMGRSYMGCVNTYFRKWLKIVNRFIEKHGVEKVPVDIKGAMKDTESNLGVPVTFKDAVYMGES